MLNMLAFIGLLILSFGVIFGVTAFIGWVNADYEHYIQWFFSVVLAAIFLAVLIYEHIV